MKSIYLSCSTTIEINLVIHTSSLSMCLIINMSLCLWREITRKFKYLHISTTRKKTCLIGQKIVWDVFLLYRWSLQQLAAVLMNIRTLRKLWWRFHARNVELSSVWSVNLFQFSRMGPSSVFSTMNSKRKIRIWKNSKNINWLS